MLNFGLCGLLLRVHWIFAGFVRLWVCRLLLNFFVSLAKLTEFGFEFRLKFRLALARLCGAEFLRTFVVANGS